MEKIDTRVRATMMGMFEQYVDKMGKVATAATVRVLGEEKLGEKGTSPLPFITPSPIANPEPPPNILSHWAWVETETVELIVNGKFDINTLSKLHRKDELRNAYIRKVVKGIYQPLTGGPSEIMIGTTKMQASFKDSTTFFSAWQVYISIRTSYQPKRGPGLADWTERLFYLISLDYPWPAILEYIIAYFQKYQDTLPDDWFNPDSNLISYHFALSPQRQVAVSVPATTPTSNSRPKLQNQSNPPIADEICVGWNRQSGCQWKERKGEDCPRRHVCSICVKGGHNRYKCPSKAPSSNSK
ncbi:MAG: hypothetical protein E6J34_15120 [Chloroflexi bacterium]|nr:MAG: hypothetical protein E6J34_15120 [Chloroflexota bacterium]